MTDRPIEMTGGALRAIRKRLGLKAHVFGAALGLGGSVNTIRTTVSKWEHGTVTIPVHTARLALMFDRFGVPDDFLNGG